MKRFLMILIAIMATTLTDATAASAPVDGEGGALAGVGGPRQVRAENDPGLGQGRRAGGRDRSALHPGEQLLVAGFLEDELYEG